MGSSRQRIGSDTCGEEWEDGKISGSFDNDDHQNVHETDLRIVIDESPSSGRRKRVRRVSAEDKELVELVHKVHLLCLLGRGRLVDSTCDDSLIQASLLSLLPRGILNTEDVPTLTVDKLVPVVTWFRNSFCIKCTNFREGNLKENILHSVASREGTAEEVTALSVSLFRALNLPTRFVSILDVTSLNPDTDDPWAYNQDLPKLDPKISSPTLSKAIVSNNGDPTLPPVLLSSTKSKETAPEQIKRGRNKKQDRQLMIDSCDTNEQVTCANNNQNKGKKKGDVEFEMQLEMALSATAAGSFDCNPSQNNADICSSSSATTSFKSAKKSLNQAVTGAVWSRKKGPPLFWAEVFCKGESSTGKWVHVDAANGMIAQELQVESASAASKRPLKYVVAFSGLGAKDVTRRYCMHWYKILSKRIDGTWWARVLAHLKQLRSAATEADSTLAQVESTEDMELEIRALTEPLPGNQQAYRRHHLYALEKFLSKYEALYPKGPVLGYCSGHPVYPRACVQRLQTRQRWLREGLQVKSNEAPAKKFGRRQRQEEGAEEGSMTLELYGKWQVEPLILPPAVDGMVPKNERGQVEVWSEKCLPPGTVHLRLPRLAAVARRLGVDFAPAMIGFEFRNGRSYPVFEGIVICSEFKDAIMEAYAEEERRREADEKRRREAQALSRWYQLLSSLITRERLSRTYLEPSKAKEPEQEKKPENTPGKFPQPVSHKSDEQDHRHQKDHEQHEHVFPIEDQSFDSESFIRTKRCPCGFSIEMEEL
ncbi:DNA repair protein Rad4 family isoform X2 [Wolffia australiana]